MQNLVNAGGELVSLLRLGQNSSRQFAWRLPSPALMRTNHGTDRVPCAFAGGRTLYRKHFLGA